MMSCLAIGTAVLLLTASSAEAFSDAGPQYHPVAADLNNLAQNVRRCTFSANDLEEIEIAFLDVPEAVHLAEDSRLLVPFYS
jgi:hypothetical protein